MSKQSDLLAKLQKERLESNTKTTAPKPDSVAKAKPEEKSPKPVVAKKKAAPKKKAVKEGGGSRLSNEETITKSMSFRASDLECMDRITMGLFPRGVRANGSIIIRAAIRSVDLDDPEKAEAFAELVKQLQSEDGRRKS